MRFNRLLPILAVVALAGAACGASDTGSSASDPAPSAAPASDHNQADIGFLQGMIPHHAQAIEMSDLALERSDNPRVVDLARRINAAQGPEIEQMEGLLQQWGVKAAGGESGGGEDHGGHGGGHGGGGGHEGMLSEEELMALEAAEGAEFDRSFLNGMIAHHRGAVVASQAELGEGQSPEAKELAQAIIDAQEAEIAEMEQLLNEI